MFQWRKRQSTDGEQRAENRSPSDAELVCAARAGDKRAFVEIVARHQAMVCGVALGVLSDFAASEDAGQEAFLTAWRKIHELREPQRLRPWLAQIARNAALGHLRRTRGHDELDEANAVVDHRPGPDEVVASEEEFALVRDVLAKLPETYRLPLVLFYREGQSVHAVAETIGITEDAVKQRLARGREMLRDRMAGTVETVLTRTRPTAVFTMAIAAAIGALAAPAAVASAAFAGTSAVTVSSATNSLFAAMSASKTSLAAAALVAVVCIPVGYYVAAPEAAATKGTADPVALEVAASDGRTNREPTFENSALFAEWRRLHELHGTTPEAMPALYKAIGDLQDPFRRRAFRNALLAEWVQVDPAGGLQFLAGKSGDSSQRQQFFEEWLSRDAAAAVEALLRTPGWETMARDALKEIARRVPARIPEIVQRLPKSESYWDTSVRDAFAIVAEGGLDSARAAVERISGPNRDAALAGIAQAWAKSDLNAAIAWARSLPAGTDRDEVIRGALMGTAAVSPAVALENAHLVPPGGRDGYFATTTGARVIKSAAASDYDATVQWLAAHPARFSREDLLGLADAVTRRLMADPVAFLNQHSADGSLKSILPALESALLNEAGGQRAAVWQWLKKQPELDGSWQSLRGFVLNAAGWQDPPLAMELAAELPKTREGDAEIQRLAQSFWNGGQHLSRFDQLYEQAPDRLRSSLIQSAYSVLRPDNLSDVQPWIARLQLAPEATRPQLMNQLARAWASQSPESALEWAQTIPAEQTRSDAINAVAQAWASSDAAAAASWASSMPAGFERDRIVQSLATGMAYRHPSQALEWAMSINNETIRFHGALQVLQQASVRDPGAARRLLESSSMPAETKAQFQQELERRNRRLAP